MKRKGERKPGPGSICRTELRSDFSTQTNPLIAHVPHARSKLNEPSARYRKQRNGGAWQCTLSTSAVSKAETNARSAFTEVREGPGARGAQGTPAKRLLQDSAGLDQFRAHLDCKAGRALGGLSKGTRGPRVGFCGPVRLNFADQVATTGIGTCLWALLALEKQGACRCARGVVWTH